MMEDKSPDLELVTNEEVAEKVSLGPQRILVVGGSGMLGRDVVDVLVGEGHHVRSPERVDFDVTIAEHIDRLRKQDFGSYDWIVNCAAYTAVDQAETERMAAMALNAIAPGMLGVAAQGCGARVLHFSTDFVFDGRADSPYSETSATNPLGSYGRSKLLGEENLMKEAPSSVICRTSWLFGPHGKSFPRTMIEAWRAGKELRVVNDQTGCPTYTKDLAKLTATMIREEVGAGVYHTVGPEAMTWWDLAVLAIEQDLAHRGESVDVSGAIAQVPSSEYPTPAKRPAYSVLSTAKIESLGFTAMRPVGEALSEFVVRLSKSEQG